MMGATYPLLAAPTGRVKLKAANVFFFLLFEIRKIASLSWLWRNLTLHLYWDYWQGIGGRYGGVDGKDVEHHIRNHFIQFGKFVSFVHKYQG